MKALFTLAMAALTLAACHGQSSDIDNQKKINRTLDEMVAKGMIKTTEGGYTMTATVAGKPWKADAMYPVDLNGSIHAFYGESTIDLPYWEGYKTGSKTDFSHGHGPIFTPVGSTDFYTVHTGQMEITKASGDWLEGTFSFTAVMYDDHSKTIEVTNGFFRVAKKGH